MAKIAYNGMELEMFNPDKTESFNPPIKCVGWNNKDVMVEFELSSALSKDIWLHRFIGKSKDDTPVVFMFCAILPSRKMKDPVFNSTRCCICGEIVTHNDGEILQPQIYVCQFCRENARQMLQIKKFATETNLKVEIKGLTNDNLR